MSALLTLASTAIVITASDRCFAGVQEDRSGPAVAALLRSAQADVLEEIICSDDLDILETTLRSAAERARLIVTTGGTGLSARDVTPEATLRVCDRLVPGVPELMRQQGARETPFAALGRGVCGVCGTSLILNLPGSPGGAVSSLQTALPLLPHALALLAGHTTHLTNP